MKTLLALLITMSFAFNAQAYSKDDTVRIERISFMLDEASKMNNADLGFKIIVTINALESIANTNIRDPELIKRITDNVETLDQSFSNSQRASVKRNLYRLSNR